MTWFSKLILTWDPFIFPNDLSLTMEENKLMREFNICCLITIIGIALLVVGTMIVKVMGYGAGAESTTFFTGMGLSFLGLALMLRYVFTSLPGVKPSY